MPPSRTGRRGQSGRAREHSDGPPRCNDRRAQGPPPILPKCGDLRLVSHHDLLRCLERALRRAEIPVAVTQGFNPRPKVTFALALALGIEGRREVVEIDLAEPMEPAEVLSRLAATSPPGLEWSGAEPATSNRAAQATAVLYRLDSPELPRRGRHGRHAGRPVAPPRAGLYAR